MKASVSEQWERYLQRWLDAGLIDLPDAERIRAYEAGPAGLPKWRWPVLAAVSLGGLLLGAGVLLFVAAHWDRLSETARLVSVLALVSVFQVAGALVGERFAILAMVLHTVGTVCLGPGIFLALQIFNLQEHWPTGVLLWALGAWTAWRLLGDWPQAALGSLLIPAWLSSAWIKMTGQGAGCDKILAAGLLLLSITYFTALPPGKDHVGRKILVWIGGLALLPAAIAIIFAVNHVPPGCQWGWLPALGLPLGLAWWLRRGAAWINLLAALWVLLLAASSQGFFAPGGSGLAVYGVCLLGAVGLIAWGVQESLIELIYQGLLGFTLTVLCFYFSTVMDKLGRAASLVGLGILFLLGGWLLEKTRRRLVAGLKKVEV
jgi:uncharacterized membrane protein